MLLSKKHKHRGIRRRIKIASLVLVTSLVLSNSIWLQNTNAANVVYIDSAAGDDSHSGKSPETAVQSMKKAKKLAGAGGKIIDLASKKKIKSDENSQELWAQETTELNPDEVKTVPEEPAASSESKPAAPEASLNPPAETPPLEPTGEALPQPAAPEGTPEAVIETTPEVSEEGTPETSGEGALEVSVEPTPEVSVEPTPEASVEAAPEVSVEPAPLPGELPPENTPTETKPESLAPEVSGEPAALEKLPETNQENSPSTISSGTAAANDGEESIPAAETQPENGQNLPEQSEASQVTEVLTELKVTVENQSEVQQVEKAAAAYEALNEEDKSKISKEHTNRLQKAKLAARMLSKSSYAAAAVSKSTVAGNELVGDLDKVYQNTEVSEAGNRPTNSTDQQKNSAKKQKVTDTKKPSDKINKPAAVKTGDNTQILTFAFVGIGALIIIIAWIIITRKKNKN